MNTDLPEHERSPRRARIAWICWLFVLVYTLFQFAHPAIIGAKPSPLTGANANPWLLRYIHEQDGVELYIATTGLFVFLSLTSQRKTVRAFSRFLSSRIVSFGGIAGAGIIIAMTRSTEFVGMTRPLTSIAVFLLTIGGLSLLLWQSSLSSMSRRTVWTVAGIASAIILLSGAGPSPADYGFFIGPALKMMQGEPLGSFYMQYGLLGTGLFAGMMAMNFNISAMEFGIAVMTVIWFLMYLVIATKLFLDRQIGLLFFSALFLLRFLGLNYHPAVYPQASPFRIDIWVPLLLVAWKFGFSSWRTGAAFAAGWILDAVFGLFAICAYLLTIIFSMGRDWRTGEKWAWRKHLAAVVPVVSAVGIQILLFGGVVPAAAADYQNVQLGFIPIAEHSLFWPLLLALPFAAWGILSERNTKKKELGFFMIVLSGFQLIYFFGRSHDHNLLNISGSWILLFCLAWESRFQGYSIRRRLLPPIAFCALTAAFAGPRVRAKVGALAIHVSAMDPFPSQQIDIDIDWQENRWPAGDSSVVFFASDDSYWNYRLHLMQHGYFVPAFSSVFRAETTTFLANSLQKGRRVVINKTIPSDWIVALNDDPVMVRRRQHFTVAPIDSRLRQLILARTPVDSVNKMR